MRVAHLITTLAHGGAEKQVLQLCCDFLKSGHSVTVGCLKSGGTLRKEFEGAGIAVQEFGMRNVFDALVYFRIKKWLQSQHPDLLHTHLMKADYWGGKAAVVLGIPLVCTKWNEDRYLENPILSYEARRTASRCDRIIVVSKAAIKYFGSLGFPESKMDLIYPGVRPADSQTSKTLLRFGVVARLYEQKGHKVLFRALRHVSKELPELRVVIIGTGPLEGELKEAVIEQGLQKFVQFAGLVESEDKIYEQMDVLLLPSLWEGTPLVVLEAMGRGVPVIASDVGGVSEILNSDCGILVPPNDVEALALAMIQLGKDAVLRSKLSGNARVRVAEFSPERTLQSHLQVYEQVMKHAAEN